MLRIIGLFLRCKGNMMNNRPIITGITISLIQFPNIIENSKTRISGN